MSCLYSNQQFLFEMSWILFMNILRYFSNQQCAVLIFCFPKLTWSIFTKWVLSNLFAWEYFKILISAVLLMKECLIFKHDKNCLCQSPALWQRHPAIKEESSVLSFVLCLFSIESQLTGLFQDFKLNCPQATIHSK